MHIQTDAIAVFLEETTVRLLEGLCIGQGQRSMHISALAARRRHSISQAIPDERLRQLAVGAKGSTVW
ncbi:MAG: hypothetical protein GY826_44505 [Fuerstiella sp.]|nr:hypothetical protein [Fuerstiella sp.]